jgi:uncharacterized protein DUF481
MRSMRTRSILTAFCCIADSFAGAQAPPSDTVRLVNGTVLIGRIASVTGGKVRMTVPGLGELSLDSALVARPQPPPSAAVPSPWSGALSLTGSYASEIVPGVVGSSLGVQVTGSAARAITLGNVTLDGTLGYFRTKPTPAAVDQWGLVLGWRRQLVGRLLAIGRSTFDVNRVQTLRYRATALAGVGVSLAPLRTVSLILAPAVGYTRSEQTAEGRVLAFAAGSSPGAEGIVTGLHDMLMWQLTPMLALQQDALWLTGLDARANRQLLLDLRLTGMLTPHLGMLTTYLQQYDGSMPAPVNRTIRTLQSGVQVKF